MTSLGMQFVLLVFGAIGFVGTGSSLAVGRYRTVVEGESDIGVSGVAVLLFLFGSLCTALAATGVGVLAFGAVVTWLSYIFMAQHLGLFTIETLRPIVQEQAPERETRRSR